MLRKPIDECPSVRPPDEASFPPDNAVQVLILERHAASRLGYGVLLQRQPWVSRCLLSIDADEAIELAGRAKPDLAIVDVSDAGPSVSAQLKAMRAAHPGITVVLSTRAGSVAQIAAARTLAAAVLTPADTPEQIVQVVLRALTGRRRPAEDRSRHAAGSESAMSHPSRDALSAREREVLLLLSTGATNREIAETLEVSTETVKKHARGLYRKLGVRNRTEAARSAPGLRAA